MPRYKCNFKCLQVQNALLKVTGIWRDMTGEHVGVSFIVIIMAYSSSALQNHERSASWEELEFLSIKML